jgi:TPR repeat protein
MNQLVQIYLKGDGIKKNIPEAIRLYQMAVELDDTTSFNHLAKMYYKCAGI